MSLAAAGYGFSLIALGAACCCASTVFAQNQRKKMAGIIVGAILMIVGLILI